MEATLAIETPTIPLQSKKAPKVRIYLFFRPLALIVVLWALAIIAFIATCWKGLEWDAIIWSGVAVVFLGWFSLGLWHELGRRGAW
jgi:hypothetical protein